MFGTIAEARIALLRLLGVQSTNPELIARGEGANDTVDNALLSGLWKAQRFLIDVGAGDDWLTSAALTFGATDAAGLAYATAPTDLLRFAGDADFPALYDSSNGTPWGVMLRDKRRRRYATGDVFWWADGKIYTAKLANRPSAVGLDYYQKLALPVANAEVDMREVARDLWIAEAGYHAMNEYWVPTPEGVTAMETRLTRNWVRKRQDAAAALRVEDGKQNLNDQGTVGSHYFYR